MNPAMLREPAARVVRAARRRLRGTLRSADRRAGRERKSSRDTEKLASLAARAEEERREQFAVTASQFTPYAAREYDGALFFVGMESTFGRKLFARRQWRDDHQLDRTLRALKLADLQLVRTTFVDIGAHVGTSTIQALRRYGFTSALAFEPEPENFRILRANLAANGLDERVRVFNVALSNRVGSSALEVRDRGSGEHKLVRDGEQVANAIRVPLTTFDTLAKEGAVDPDEAGLVWIDVEGSEIDVLEGARTLLERSLPMVIEFVWRRYREEPGRLESLIDLLTPSHTHFFSVKPKFRSDRVFEPLSAIHALPRRNERANLLVVRLAKSSVG